MTANSTSTTTMSSTEKFCRLVSDNNDGNDDRPPELPRYTLCQLEDASQSTPLRGLVVKDGAPPLAYYSSMGEIPTIHSTAPTRRRQRQRRRQQQGSDKKSHTQTRAIDVVFILVHGSGRNAQQYLCGGISSSTTTTTTTTMVISPLFMSDTDMPEVGDAYLRWAEDGPISHTWRYGADSIRGYNISSYQAMDSLVEQLVLAATTPDNNPLSSVKRIVVAGHSAGGQLVHRWALTSNSTLWSSRSNNRHSRMDTESSLGNDRSTNNDKGCNDTDIVEKDVQIRVIPANPRSFCYLDSRRFTSDIFDAPNTTRVEACPTYDTWEWGLQTNNSRLPTPYVERALMNGTDQLLKAYATRDVVYLAGELDVLSVESECEDDDFQGPNRRVRSHRFFRSLPEIYGRQVHRRFIAKGSPHDHSLMFQSEAGQKALFSDLDNNEKGSNGIDGDKRLRGNADALLC